MSDDVGNPRFTLPCCVRGGASMRGRLARPVQQRNRDLGPFRHRQSIAASWDSLTILDRMLR